MTQVKVDADQGHKLKGHDGCCAALLGGHGTRSYLCTGQSDDGIVGSTSA